MGLHHKLRWPARPRRLRLATFAPERLKFSRGAIKEYRETYRKAPTSTGGLLHPRVPLIVKPSTCECSSWLFIPVTAVPRTEVVAAIQAFTDYVPWAKPYTGRHVRATAN